MAKPVILLDTTYLLPVFGIDVGLDEYEALFPRLLEEFKVYYSPLSLVEAKWVVLRVSKAKPGISRRLLEEYRRGLEAIVSDSRLEETIVTNSVIEEAADYLLELGIRDYFDRMIYATAYYYKAMLLTEDRDLKLVSRKTPSYRPLGIMSWAEIRSALRRR